MLRAFFCGPRVETRGTGAAGELVMREGRKPEARVPAAPAFPGGWMGGGKIFGGDGGYLRKML